jgi:hypothetical protein
MAIAIVIMIPTLQTWMDRTSSGYRFTNFVVLFALGQNYLTKIDFPPLYIPFKFER